MHITTIFLLTLGLLFISRVQATLEPESELTEFFKRSEISDDDEEWVDLTAGLMMQAPDSPTGPSSLNKRDGHYLGKRESTSIFVERDGKTGNIILPRSWSDVKNLVTRNAPRFITHHVKRGSRHVARSMKVIITWYTGHDLLNPSCLSNGNGWAPTDSSMVGAVTIAWSTKPPCGEFVKIRHSNKKNKYVIVRILDSCGGCQSGSAHIDLTTGAFKKLYDLDVGKVYGLQAKIVKAPKSHKWSKADVARYGPKKL
ncbi:secreted protein [Melampsora americana]|nr:secreted protein [Melampsora americana]KAH9816037.1 secreted protein [Melampsora americana]